MATGVWDKIVLDGIELNEQEREEFAMLSSDSDCSITDVTPTSSVAEEKELFCEKDQVTVNAASMRRLFDDQTLCDIWLKVNDESIGAHKIVLSHVPHLHDILEKTHENTIEMTGMDMTTLKCLLQFVYGGTVPISMSNVRSVLIGAKKFQMNQAIDFCSNFLLSKIDKTNVLFFHDLAAQVNCMSLFEATGKFIDNNFAAIVKTEEFRDIGLDQVTRVLARDTLLVNNEEQVVSAALDWLHVDHEKRISHVSQILKVCRLPLVKNEYLVERVSADFMVRTSVAARDVMHEAKQWFLMPERRNLIKTFKTYTRTCPAEKNIFILGGYPVPPDPANSQMEVYNPNDKTFKEVQRMGVRRTKLAATSMGRCIYAMGGMAGLDRLNLVEVYDVDNDIWRQLKSPLKFRRNSLAAASLFSRVFAIGGYDGIMGTDVVEMYEPDRSRWTQVRSMNKKRSGIGAAVMDGKIYVFGGHERRIMHDSFECFDPAIERWYDISKPMPTKLCRYGTTVLNGQIYLVGGYNGKDFVSCCQAYDPRSGEWNKYAEMNQKRARLGIAENMGNLYVFGGTDGATNFRSMEIFDSTANTWMATGLKDMGVHVGEIAVCAFTANKAEN